MPADRPGNYKLKELRLIGRNDEIVDLDNYMVELNIHEDIFGNAVHGTCIVVDQSNILRFMALEGQEILLVHMLSDRFPEDENSEIKRQFRVFSVSERYVIRERNMQGYTLHFCSFETFKSALTPLYRPFEGDTVTEVAELIFDEYLLTERYPGVENELDIFDEASNPIKFISPGWQPYKCMNWLAQKAISTDGSGCNFLFWETTKRFYFGSLERLFQIVTELGEEGIVGRYHYRPSNIYRHTGEDYGIEFFKLENIDIINTSDQLSMTTNGELASTVLTIDINKKEFTNTIYDHSVSYSTYTHLPVDGEGRAIWGTSVELNPKNSIYFYPKNTKLFDEFPNNTNEVYKDIYGKRLANLRDIHNFRLNITIPGRTDIQAGSMIFLYWPNAVDRTMSSFVEAGYDERYSGVYIVTAVRHKFNSQDYVCILEVSRDSFSPVLAQGQDESPAETARLLRQNAEIEAGASAPPAAPPPISPEDL